MLPGVGGRSVLPPTARRRDGKTFYCPNGCSLSYHETTEQRLTAQLEAAKRQRDNATAEAQRQEEMRRKEERRCAAYRGKLTSMKRRARGGACPCCNRTFTNLRRHMATKHPAFGKEP